MHEQRVNEKKTKNKNGPKQHCVYEQYYRYAYMLLLVIAIAIVVVLFESVRFCREPCRILLVYSCIMCDTHIL